MISQILAVISQLVSVISQIAGRDITGFGRDITVWGSELSCNNVTGLLYIVCYSAVGTNTSQHITQSLGRQ